ncbi:TonB-dependent receptor plug domain-containing protein [Chitinophaga sp. Cy-1792]|uniref:TonB-dependent receptor plug domain-containing protein n=1 Tax=Chitinophaga sp. Cy-1792 TaxID=2608339 RepID=UPI00141E5F15|nr:TonB-dependent receptor plug domain-containing protein [Chitinophaga sp. Cy-1792]NIG55506.1 TonB-dependent receptor plug domain-containing protein [Chitinophaga sp. Cy-1792]
MPATAQKLVPLFIIIYLCRQSKDLDVSVNRTNYLRVINLGLCLATMLLMLIPAGTYAQQASGVLSGNLWDKDSSRVADIVTVVATAADNKQPFSTVSDEQGHFLFKQLPYGTYTIGIYSMRYQAAPLTIHFHKDQPLEIIVTKKIKTLSEVYVTAAESKGLSTASVIDRKAMSHLQPSSFSDLMELLPGGRATDPKLTAMNQVKLRETGGGGSDFNISSLGTAFLIDGAPVNTSANLQSSSAFVSNDPNSGKSAVNAGVDMRNISTDQIESVEIIRGIPSVEYGDLTSGLVKINRVKGATTLNVRMKADGFSKLFAVGKGFDLPAQKMTLNFDLGYLKAKADPTNSFENYNRINASVRTEKHWITDKRLIKWNAALDYSTNIDNKRTDPDNSYALTDKYKSTYNSYGISSSIRSQAANRNALWQSWEIAGQLNYQHNRMDITKWMQAKSATVLFNSLTAGEHDIMYLTPSYTSYLLVDGQPLLGFLKAQTNLQFKAAGAQHQVKVGMEANYSKNLGKGQQYDINFPPTESIMARPRAFDSIPGMLNVAGFAEDALTWHLGRHTLVAAGGVRAMTLAGMDSRYALANKIYLDPRVNTRWTLPNFYINAKPLTVTLGGGYGLQTKMPTTDQLYPLPQYLDFVQLNYFHNNPAYRRANAVTYINSRVNYDLLAAVNKKLEFTGDITFNENRLSFSWFHEYMNSGFRSVSALNYYSYKKYDVNSVDAAKLDHLPELSEFNYETTGRYYGTSKTTNGSKLIKNGVEFQFASRRITAINTRFTVTGAYYRTTYSDNQPTYKIDQQVAVNGNIAQYIGVFTDPDASIREQFNTNIMADSYLPNLGLIVSASVQNLWFTSSQTSYKSGVPAYYIAPDGKSYPFTSASYTDPQVNYLVTNYSGSAFFKYVVPIDLQVNLKVSKEFKKVGVISMFVNRLLTYTPDYTSFGTTKRRSGLSSPYFGMEMNFKL